MNETLKDFNFGLRVKSLLEQKGIAQSDFLKQTGIPIQRYYDWIKKGCSPSVITAFEVAQFLGMTVEQILLGSGTDPLQPVVNSLQDKLSKISEIICS